MRLLLFLSALLTGLTGLLPGVGMVGARQVAERHAATAQIAVAATRAQIGPGARPAQPLVRDPRPVFLTPAPHIAVRDRTQRAHE